MPDPPPEPIPDAELAAILAAAILDGRGGSMTRDASMFLASVCADYLVDRLALAGVVAVRLTVTNQRKAQQMTNARRMDRR
jgi:hypothetical protein